jgi:hypothetical protein
VKCACILPPMSVKSSLRPPVLIGKVSCDAAVAGVAIAANIPAIASVS